MEPWYQRFYKYSTTNCITFYNKPKEGVHALDPYVSYYRIDVHGKKWYWPHYINTTDVLKLVSLKVFSLSIPELKYIFWHIFSSLLKNCKNAKTNPPNIIYLWKRIFERWIQSSSKWENATKLLYWKVVSTKMQSLPEMSTFLVPNL